MTKWGFSQKEAVTDLDYMAVKSNSVINAAYKSSLLVMEQIVQEARGLVVKQTR